MQGHTHAGMAIETAMTAQDAGLGRLAYDALKWHASKLVPKLLVAGFQPGQRGGGERFVEDRSGCDD